MPLLLPVSRRRFLATGAALAANAQLARAARALGLTDSASICRTKVEQEVGPYYVADELLRSDLTEGKPGIPLLLRVAILDARTCKPLADAAIDIWHCDALGLYSGFTKIDPTGPMGPGGPGGGPGGHGPGGPPPGFDPQHPNNRPGPPEGMGPPPAMHTTDKLTFCRGIQRTDPAGAAQFTTIVPGFYMGRTNHIHFKVRIGGHEAKHTYAAGHTSHTGQIFLPEELAVDLMQHDPYRQHHIERTTQAEDHVFQDQGGSLSIARVVPLRPGDLTAGYRAELIAAVDPTATPKPAHGFGGPPPPRANNPS